MTSARRSEAGFSIQEALIGAGILVAIVAACLGSQFAATSLMGESVIRSGLEERAIFALREVAFETRWADGAAVLLSSEHGSDRIDLQTLTAFAAGNPVWSTVITYRVEPSTEDTNGNSVADEGRLVRVQDGVTRVLCDGLMPGGFTATRAGDQVTLAIRLFARHRGRIVVSEAATTATIRN